MQITDAQILQEYLDGVYCSKCGTKLEISCKEYLKLRKSGMPITCVSLLFTHNLKQQISKINETYQEVELPTANP